MSAASKIVAGLLESDDLDFHSEIDGLVNDLHSGEVNAISAQKASTFYSRLHTYKDGKTPIQVRRNGTTKVWKHQPGKFRIPVKYGMRDYFYIDNDNAHEWSITPTTIKK